MVAFFARSCFVFAAFFVGNVAASDTAVLLLDAVKQIDALLLQKDKASLQQIIADLTDANHLTLYSLIASHEAFLCFVISENKSDALLEALTMWHEYKEQDDSLEKMYGNLRSRLNL
jgi:hypothetical protein